MLPVSQEMLNIVRGFIDKTYSSLCSTNDLPFRANAVEVYPKSEGGYSVLLYKTQPPVGGDLDKVFEYNTDPTSNKAYMDFCKGLEKYINSLDEYKYFKFQVIPGRKLTKQVVNFIIYPEHKFDKPTSEDLEKFDIKELTKDSRLKQNESADPVESDRIKESFDPAEEAFLNGTPYCPDCYDDDDVDDEGYDAGDHYVGAEDDAFVADFIRDQAKDEMPESENLISKFLKLREWTGSVGYISNNGNHMVGGKYASSSSGRKEYEKQVEVEYEGSYYEVDLFVFATLSGGYDESTNWSWSDIEIDDIQLKQIYNEETNGLVTDSELQEILFKKAAKIIEDERDDYFDTDWYEEEDYRDYEPFDWR